MSTIVRDRNGKIVKFDLYGPKLFPDRPDSHDGHVDEEPTTPEEVEARFQVELQVAKKTMEDALRTAIAPLQEEATIITQKRDWQKEKHREGKRLRLEEIKKNYQQAVLECENQYVELVGIANQQFQEKIKPLNEKTEAVLKIHRELGEKVLIQVREKRDQRLVALETKAAERKLRDGR